MDISLLFLGLFQFFPFIIEGCLGFGATLISAPFNASWMGVTNSVPFDTLMATPILYYGAIKFYKQCNYKELGKVLLILAPGFILGNYLGTVLDPIYCSVAIGMAISIIAIINISRNIIMPKFSKDNNHKQNNILHNIFKYFCLIMGSIFHGAFTIGGPFLTVYLIEAIKDKFSFRSTMFVMWVCLDTFNVLRMGLTNRFNPYVLQAVLVGMPFAFIGYLVGVKFLDKINQKQFLKLVYVFLLLIGLNMFVRNVLLLV